MSPPGGTDNPPAKALALQEYCYKIKYPSHITLWSCAKTGEACIVHGVKTLTGNVELLQILNRYGHGISYHQLEENDTAL